MSNPPPPPGPPQGQPYPGPQQPGSGQPHYGQPQQPYPGQQQPAYGQQPYGVPAYPSMYGGPAAPAQPLSSAARIIGFSIAGIGVLTIICAFLPWVTVGDLSFSGIGGDDVGGAKDGVITLPLGVLIAVAGVIFGLGVGGRGLRLGMAITALVLSLLVALIGIIDIADVNDIGEIGLDVGVGIGLTLTLVFGIIGAGASIAAIIKRS